MKKLLVVLLALATVAAFGAVNFSGYLRVTPNFTYDASEASFSWNIQTRVRLFLSASNESTTTGFQVTIDRPSNSAGEIVQLTNETSSSLSFMLDYDTYLWQKIYTSDSFTVTLKEGMIRRGFYYDAGSTFSWWITPPYMLFYNQSPTVALDFAVASGDLSDNLALYVYAPNATSADLDIWNNLSFGFFSIDTLIKGVLSAASQTEFPEIGAKATVDLSKALNISNASLKGYGFFVVDPSASDINSMLNDYVFGVDFGYEKIKGSVAFQKGNLLGLALKTTVLSPVTIGGDVVLNVTDPVNAFSLAGYATWKFELLSNTVYMTYDAEDKAVSAGWRMQASF